MDSGVGERAVLSDGRRLQSGRPEIGERITAGIVVVIVSADVAAEVENGVVANDVRVRGRDVECTNLGMLIGVANIHEGGIGAGASADSRAAVLNVLDVQVLEGVGIRKP